MDDVTNAYSFNNHALLRLHETIKVALDPNGILAPGKSGIWPNRMRRPEREKGNVMLAMSLLPGAGAWAADDSAREKGRLVYQKWCTPCRGTGLGRPGTIASAAHNRGTKPPV